MGALSIRERQAGHVDILDLNGQITIGEGSVALHNVVRRLLGEGKKNILLNLAGVSYLDSSGISELVSSYTAVNNEGGQVRLLNLPRSLQGVLMITKLLTVFQCYDNEAEALSTY